jgi:hypothetical protein
MMTLDARDQALIMKQAGRNLKFDASISARIQAHIHLYEYARHAH